LAGEYPERGELSMHSIVSSIPFASAEWNDGDVAVPRKTTNQTKEKGEK
jgi:hypothetical protein